MLEQQPIPQQWREALETYLHTLGASKTPESTIYLRKYHLRRFAIETGFAPFSLDLDDLIEYLDGHSEWATGTARSVRTSLRSFYAWAFVRGRTSENIAEHLPKIKSPIGKPRPAPLQAIAKGERAHDYRVRLMVQLAAYAGRRCCEIAVVHSRDLIDDLIGTSLIVHGKGGKERTVPLRNEVAHLLRQCPAGYVFPGLKDGHLSASYVSKLLSRALPDGVTAHMLRHSFASRAYVASGFDIRAIQELLGHASVATTQIYTAVDDGQLRRAVAF